MRRLLPVLFLPFLLAACAIGDTATTPTPAPPITLMPPPALMLSGVCDDTRTLEYWLQVTSQQAADFQTLMNSAAAQNQQEIYEEVLQMAAVRDAVAATQTPDCAQQAQLLLVDAMNRAVAVFQAFANGDAPDLGTTVTEVNQQIDQVIVLQDSLLQRMNDQFQQQAAVTPPPA